MNYQPYLRPGFPVDPIPEPRQRVRRMMLAAATIVDGPLDAQPERLDERLAGCLYMPQANLIISGTVCARPLLLRQATAISDASGLDTMVVRGVDNEAYATFDVKKVGVDQMFCAYRMWMPRPSEAAWLIPVAGEPAFFRVTPMGLELHQREPFADWAERRIGLLRGAEYMSVAVKGWF